jgi:hypothetical protein
VKDRCEYKIAMEATEKGRNWTVHGHPIDYCLSRPRLDICQLQFNVWLMLCVVVCGICKTVIMAILFFQNLGRKDGHLRTMGDAVASFLETEDHTTRNMCLVTPNQLRKGGWKDGFKSQLYTGRQLRWYESLSRRQLYTTHGM